MADYIDEILLKLNGVENAIIQKGVELDFSTCVELVRVIANILNNETSQGEEYSTIGSTIARLETEGDCSPKGMVLIELLKAILNTCKIKNTSIEDYQNKFFSSFAKMQYYKNECRNNTNAKGNKKAKFAGKGCIYTVIVGDYDDIIEPRFINRDFDYILFTDNHEIQSNIWNIRYIDNVDKIDYGRLSRLPKILPHRFLSEYDYSIYMDGNCYTKGDIKAFIDKYSKGSPMLCFNHYTRDCLYEDELICEMINKDNLEVMRAQMDRYHKDGYPEHYGLIAGGILIREHNNPEVIYTMEQWWKELCKGSKRDQLSFNYVCWINGFYYDTCDLVLRDNDYFGIETHKTK